jgi:hypothetical protein
MDKIEKKKRVRSPNYPFVPLGEAIEFAKILYRNQKQYWVAIEVAAKDWNFRSAKTSYMSQHVAALSSFGLIDVEGEGESKKIRLSDLAFNIIIDERPQSEDREGLIKHAALKPPIFRKIYDAYPSGLPAEHTLDYELKTKYKFNPDSVKEFIKIFNKTLDFARVYKSGIMEEKNKSTEVPDMPNTDKRSISQPQVNVADNIAVKDFVQGKVLPPLIQGGAEREIANYPIGKGLKARILVSGTTFVTSETIEKLISLLQLNKEDLSEVADFDLNEDADKTT